MYGCYKRRRVSHHFYIHDVCNIFYLKMEGVLATARSSTSTEDSTDEAAGGATISEMSEQLGDEDPKDRK